MSASVDTFEYVLESDRNSPRPTKFVFRLLTRSELKEYISRVPFDFSQVRRATVVRNTALLEGRPPSKREAELAKCLQPKSAGDTKRAIDCYVLILNLALIEIVDATDENGNFLLLKPSEFLAYASLPLTQELGEALLEYSIHKRGTV